MVGGRIVSIREELDRLRVIVAERRYSRHEFMGVDCARTGHPLRLGDSLWWQCGKCYWTPRDGSHRCDTPIPKIGYSYAVGLDAPGPSCDLGEFRLRPVRGF